MCPNLHVCMCIKKFNVVSDIFVTYDGATLGIITLAWHKPCRRQGGWGGGGVVGNRGSLPHAPSVRGPPNSTGLVDPFVSHFLFCFAFYAADANNAQLSYVATAHFTS